MTFYVKICLVKVNVQFAGEESKKNDPIYLDNLFCRFVLICQLRKYVTLDNVQILLLEPIMNQMLHNAMGWNPSLSFIPISTFMRYLLMKNLKLRKYEN